MPFILSKPGTVIRILVVRRVRAHVHTHGHGSEQCPGLFRSARNGPHRERRGRNALRFARVFLPCFAASHGFLPARGPH